MYIDDDLLMLSGIQHIAFCERQWALIYIEQQWSENLLTIEGHYLHEKVDDPFFSETRKDIVYLRSLPVVSYRLGLYGKADLVELCKVTGESENAIEFPGRVGKWKITPVEYKRGKPKTDTCDEVQLCAQALCFEEMY
ncbi:MAG: Dna2/Cas4 domain-containing protein, partial [Candidatus Methanofastidiosa archaeon]|nr:Dna2/Cas4 domain-containing protein [Candidatus Methanofastidiosa archaeon]